MRAIVVVATLAMGATMGWIVVHMQGDARVQRYMDQGILLLDKHPMQALPYFIAARAEGAEGIGLNVLFAKAAKEAPVANLVVPAGDQARFVAATWNLEGTRIGTATSDSTAHLWDATTAEHQEHRYPGADSAQPYGIPTETWNAHSGKSLFDATERPPRELGVCTTGADADGRLVVKPGAYADVIGFDPVAHGPIAALRAQGVVYEGCAVARVPDGLRYLAINEREHAVIVWNPATGLPASPPLRHSVEIVRAAFSPDGSRVVTETTDIMVRSWDATTGQPLGPAIGPFGSKAVFSPDGTRILLAGGFPTVYDVATGLAVTLPLMLGEGESSEIGAFSPDGKRFVAAGGTTAMVWDIASGVPVSGRFDHESPIGAVMFRPDGKRVLTILRSGEVVHVWQIATDTRHIPSPTRVTPLGQSCSGAPTTPSDVGTLDEWRRFARCTPFSLRGDVLVPNLGLVPLCYPTDCRVEPFIDFQ